MISPTKFETVKQPMHSKVCGAAVAAMAVGESLQYAVDQMESTLASDGEPFYKTREVLKFLGGHGIIVGIIVQVKSGNLWRDADINIQVNMKEMVALVVVKSEIKGRSHFVFWDGENVRDPSTFESKLTNIEDYEVEEFYPLTYIDESGEHCG